MPHAEPVLLVNNCEREIFKFHIFFNQRVGADDDIHFSFRAVGKQFFAGLAFDRTGEQSQTHRQTIQHIFERDKMLLGQNFRRGHERGLELVFAREQHCGNGHHCFAAAYIALQEPVHREIRGEVGENFVDDFFLRAGELESAFCFERGEQVFADLVAVGAEYATFVTGQSKHDLNGKEFLKARRLRAVSFFCFGRRK